LKRPVQPLRRDALPASRRLVVLGLLLGSAAWVQAQPFAYITNQGSHDVSVIDLASHKVVATVPVGRSPAGVVASSRGGRVYVSNPDSKTISVIDMR
jgi:YVTN family beta-propeller protein